MTAQILPRWTIDSKTGWLIGVVKVLRLRGRRFLRRHGRNASAESNQEGQALVEFALTSCVIFGFVFCLIELCLAFYTHCVVSETAREATRYAMVRGATCVTASQASCTATTSSVNTYASGLGWPNLGNGTLNVATTFPDGNQNPGSRVKVRVTYVFPVTLVFVPQNSISMSSTSEMYILQ
jgi:Flp pilus assembly protein TadG